jgi:hypothetical protein
MTGTRARNINSSKRDLSPEQREELASSSASCVVMAANTHYLTILANNRLGLPRHVAVSEPELHADFVAQKRLAKLYGFGVGYARCRTVGVPRTRLCTRSSTSLSARTERSCWRKCSVHESTRKVSR